MTNKTAPTPPETDKELLTPEEKKLSLKLLEELHPNTPSEPKPPESKTSESKPIAPKVEPSPEIPSATVPPTESPTEPIPPKTPEIIKETKKGFHLPKLPFKFSRDKQKVEEVVPVETGQLTADALLKMIDEKTKKISGDEFLMVKISKQGFLLLIGLILVFLWVLPYLNIGAQKIINRVDVPGVENLTQDTTASGAAEPASITESKIRVRLQTNTLDAAEAIKVLLNGAGFSQIDFVYDPAVNANTVLVATQVGNEQLKQRLVDVFNGTYKVASESAVLTEDSDFAASVLVGKNSKLK